MTGKYILITRPADEAEQTAADLRQVGQKVLLSPMLEIVPVRFDKPDLLACQALIFTSARSIKFYAQACPERDIPVYVVGQQTRDMAAAQGFMVAGCAHGNSTDLQNLLSRVAPGRKLHVRGEDVTSVLAGTEPLVVYKAQAVEAFAAGVADCFHSGAVEAVTFYSRRTALNFMRLAARDGLDRLLAGIKALCISNEVLECVRADLWGQAYAAGQPDREGMMDLLRRQIHRR